ncbi:MAG: polyisoprenoid-binding protein [Bacteroidetes bacterium]|nr:MAG: polyisoprenoid-binding protein [Bacteroidota bacterium]
MKKLLYPLAAVLVLGASAFTVMNSQDWKISDDYSVKFTSADPSGVFRGLKGTVKFDETDLANSKFDVSIDVSTINTGNGMKNGHAKSAKWFDAEKYPLITFTSSSISKASTGYAAKGVLEMHGVKKDFTIPFTFDKNASGGVFNASFDVNRLDFNINTEEPAHGASVVKVDISVPVSK